MPDHETKSRARLLLRPWGLGILLSALLFALLFTLYAPQYVTNDDAVILRAFMGYEGGVPATFHLYTHTVFAWMLYGLAVLFPGVAWFSILQIALLFLSSAVIIKSFAQIAGRSMQTRRGEWAGAAAGLVFTAVFALFYTVRITYSFTAVLCGAAAVAHLFSVDFERGRGVVPRILGGAALLLCNYFLRQITVLPPLCFFALALVIKLMTGSRTRRVLRPVLIGAVSTALLFGLFAVVRAADIGLTGAGEYVDWQSARISVLDYTDFAQETSDDTLREIGWSNNQKLLAAEWFFLDDRVTADAFRAIKTQVEQDTRLPAAEHIAAAWRTSVDLFLQNPRIAFAVLGTLLMAAAGILAARRRERLWAGLGAACAVLGGAAMILYFAWLGRLNMRAALTAILPMGANLTASALAFCMPLPALKTHKALAAATALLLAGALAADGLAIANALRDAESKSHAYWGESVPEVDIDEYALLHPDTLFIHDYSMPSNEIVFPDTEFGIPANVISWGGWAIHSPSWRRMLQGFGIHTLNASVFLRDNVVFATRYDSPPQLFLDYLQENTDSPVHWEFYDTYGLIFFYTFYTD